MYHITAIPGNNTLYWNGTGWTPNRFTRQVLSKSEVEPMVVRMRADGVYGVTVRVEGE